MNFAGHARRDGARITFYLMCLLLLPVMLVFSGCTPGSVSAIPAAPVVAADQTVLDERAMIAAEQSYLAVGAAIEAATSAGILKGAAASRVERLDALAMEAVVALRAAYDTGNATSFGEALARAKSTIAQISALLGAPGRGDTSVKAQ